MKPTLLLVVFLLAAGSGLRAQVVDASVCDILAHPKNYDGKMVHIKGTVTAGFEQFALVDSSCQQSVNAIWIDYPEGTKAKAGPVALVQLQLAANSPGEAVEVKREAVVVDRNPDFKQFDTLLSTPAKSSGMCLGCGRYTVKATLTGRLDGVAATIIDNDGKGKFIAVQGFGNLNRYAARLVLQSVSDLVPQEVDYGKSAAATKGDSVPSSPGDPVAAAHTAAKVFGDGNEVGALLEKAASAFGAKGENNGVAVGFGTANETSKGEDAKGAASSPDGLLYNCTFDMSRLKGSALSKALVHVGAHIAEIRGGDAHPSNFNSEFNAWQVTVIDAIATGQKTLTLSGGHVIWNAAWAPADRDKLVGDGIREFLND